MRIDIVDDRRALQVLTLFFSATGNSEYVARLFSGQMGAECLSIEDDADFSAAIRGNETIAFCYPIFASRVPRIMREFVARHMGEISGKKIVVLVTQGLFSGDGQYFCVKLGRGV